jgi:HD superfamily phosphodiesterase
MNSTSTPTFDSSFLDIIHECLYEQYPFLNELHLACIDFVKKETYGRCPSHGLAHAQCVVENAEVILRHLLATWYENQSSIEISDEHALICKTALIVAYLHDVADHKYYSTEESKYQIQVRIDIFVESLEMDSAIVSEIIKKISYSNEVRELSKNSEYRSEWARSLGETSLLIRDIVSDADKLEAIGKAGLERCKQYSKSASSSKLSEEQADEALVKHYDEKLGLLYPQGFFKTPQGKKMAEILHNEQEEIIAEMRKKTVVV